MTGVLVVEPNSQKMSGNSMADVTRSSLPRYRGRLTFVSDTPVAIGPGGCLYAHALPSVFFCELARCFDEFVLNCPLDPTFSTDSYPYRLPENVEHSPRPHLLHKAEFFRSPRSMLAHGRAIARDVSSSDFVLFRGPSPLVPVVLALAASKRKLGAITYYCAGDFEARNNKRGLARAVVSLYSLSERLAARFMRVVVAGQALQARLGGHVLFANLIRASELPASAESLLALDELRAANGSPRIVSIGNLDANKNVSALIDAVALVVERVPGAQLDIVGDGPDRAALVAQVDDLGLRDAVTFHGRVGDRRQVEELYRQASVFVLASRSEGVPKVLLEAGSFGVPIVATAVGGVPFLVDEDDSAVLVDADDVRSMAQAIEEVLGDPRERHRLIRAGLAMARRYAHENMLAAFARAVAGVPSSAPSSAPEVLL